MQNDQTSPQNPDDQDDAAYTETNDDLKHQQVKPPSVVGEEDISGDMPAEPADIDEELAKVGRQGDDEGPKPLGD
ncbi:hypothetical protein A2697_02530 [Candidatus Curtissbacteria bacterium RIFCSPHIGHO2_01_FULL_41_44]|uniref:Uncharacterized protein n=1 Tax=Candidatus Curtissbacteria bacterium RIFCSPLOWO2_01_FULL_42_50 TaxID=1797730 RepID=A0A1F5H2K0_9BACT|nr:MAG: hypothetical protein A2697_02530 [Candidatus Curtissbacteria bacterium RIFCSPHIGHO2_01_FULL_41_44]OGD92857.1 MAG: hypothetical protein A3C33_02045 [Candidatus Curtissbacteria bacterium RIFCSPHIGHO2_02_FULL_42_58]OGD96574.1 MAG: hypothetical protein A3E71_02695 [Candidatus Curtissbacteria bacterium RIFCSPHIGHO2_12_FULL_42_33]OGD98275.1 MAG: hypothetical protein A3B54_04135 [Candidatus Curtissbacteria bacterium RIFCSPLOWO2_01_FULL_42_50]OGE03462.1 MAG: hypothetical protein A3G16_02580 [Ca